MGTIQEECIKAGLGSSVEVRPLTDKQRAAIKTLEDAFKVAKRAGIRLYGMDDSLYAYRNDLLKEVSEAMGMACEPAAHEIAENTDGYYQGEVINDQGVYCDSGGW